MTAISKEYRKHISHLKCSTQGPLPLRSFHKKERKNKPIRSLVFHTETNEYRKQIFNSPPVYSVGAGGFTMEYSKGNYIQGMLVQSIFYLILPWQLLCHVLSLGAHTIQEWEEI